MNDESKRGLIQAEFDEYGRFAQLTIQNVNSFQVLGVAGVIAEQGRRLMFAEMNAAPEKVSGIIPIHGAVPGLKI